jgi:hypothetical protein
MVEHTFSKEYYRKRQLTKLIKECFAVVASNPNHKDIETWKEAIRKWQKELELIV